MTNETDKTFTISFFKAAAILATAIIGTSVVTGFSVVSTLNSDHFILARAVSDLDELEGAVILRVELEPRLTNIERQIVELRESDIAEMKQDIREIKQAIK